MLVVRQEKYALRHYEVVLNYSAASRLLLTLQLNWVRKVAYDKEVLGNTSILMLPLGPTLQGCSSLPETLPWTAVRSWLRSTMHLRPPSPNPCSPGLALPTLPSRVLLRQL